MVRKPCALDFAGLIRDANTVIVSIQGKTGSYHDIARQEYFQNGHELLCRSTFAEVFADVSEGRADYALVAIENSLYGSINEVYDLLLKHRLWIIGELYTRIHHCLLGIDSGVELADITEVHSHPIAFAQCEEFLHNSLVGAIRVAEDDTAGSAELVAREASRHKAAIASLQASELHGLNVLRSGVESNGQNYTRFITLQKERLDNPDADKSSIIMRTDHSPGALYKALGEFYEQNINLTKLESRPIIGKVWQYQFYVDFAAGLHEERSQTVLANLRARGCTITELGTYSSDELPSETE